MSKKLYDEDFYEGQIDGSYRSAVAYAQFFSNIFNPKSVVDLGCGRGTWLKAFGECGSENLVGLDGHWNNQNQMIDQSIKFIATDLNKPIDNIKDRFDLAISVEVAEHLKEESSTTFVRNLTALSDVVMFGAAYENQGGTDHINEQPHTYWAKKFIQDGYTPYDIFRPNMWGNSNIEFWYQQNTFLYVKNTSRINQILSEAGYNPISNLEFMNCIHPHLYGLWVSKYTPKNLIKATLIKLVPKKLRPFAVKCKNKLFK